MVSKIHDTRWHVLARMMGLPQPRSAAMDQAITTPAVETSPVVELRQYTLHPGQRDVLMSLFEKKFVPGQQAAGIRLHGEFTDTGNPDRFVWLRGFPSMNERPGELDAFYGGPVWKANRTEANATMIDS